MPPVEWVASRLGRVTTVLRSQGVGGVLVRATGGSMGVKLTGTGIGFIVHVALARTMGPEEYGLYVFAFTILNLLLIPCVLGMDTAIVRFAAAYRAQDEWGAMRGLRRRADQIALAVGTVMAGGLVLVLWSVGDAMSSGLRATLMIGAPLLPIVSLSLLRQASLRALKHVVMARLPDPVIRPALLGLLLVGVLVVAGGSLHAAVVMRLNVVASVGALLVGFLMLRRMTPEQMSAAPAEYRTKEWVHTAVPLLFVATIYMLFGRIDRLMIGVMRDPAEVGFYSVAARLSSLVLFGIQAANTIAAPMISEFYASKGKGELQHLVSRIAMLIFWISTPVLIGVIVLGSWLLGIFGAEFRTAYPALLFLALGLAVNAATGPVGFLLTMTGHERTSLRIVSFCLALNVALNIPAIYYFGAVGAAAATGFTNALRNVITWRAAVSLVGVDASVWGLVGGGKR